MARDPDEAQIPLALRPHGARRRALVWRAAIGWPDYEISDQGHCRRVSTGALLTPLRRGAGTRGSGWSYTLTDGMHRQLVPIARLVYEAHVGALPSGATVFQSNAASWAPETLVVRAPYEREPRRRSTLGFGEGQERLLRVLEQTTAIHRRDVARALYGHDSRQAARRTGDLLRIAQRRGWVKRAPIAGLWSITRDGRRVIAEWNALAG